MMKSLDLLILDTCFEFFQSGDYTIDSDLLFEKLKRLCVEDEILVNQRVDSLWEENFLESSNGRYYLTDKALKLLQKLKIKK